MIGRFIKGIILFIGWFIIFTLLGAIYAWDMMIENIRNKTWFKW